MPHPNHSAIERLLARSIRRYFLNCRVKLEAHTKESLQQRVMQFPRDPLALALAFVKAKTAFPIVVVIEAAAEFLDDLGRPIEQVAHERRPANQYIRGLVYMAVHDCYPSLFLSAHEYREAIVEFDDTCLRGCDG